MYHNNFIHLILMSILLIISPMSFAVDSTPLTPRNVTATPPQNYLLGVGTISMTSSNSGANTWFNITTPSTSSIQIQYVRAPITSSIASTINTCASGYTAFITYGITRASPDYTDSGSYSRGLTADLCFRAYNQGYQAYAFDMKNQRNTGGDRYLMVNFTIICIQCASSSNCPSVMFLPPKDNNSKVRSCPS
jgi:hypothetical protein